MSREETLRLIRERHSVREYRQIPISGEHHRAIDVFLRELQAESGLEILLTDRADRIFGGALLKVIGFRHPPAACIAFVGKRSPLNAEKCGYYGEKLVLFLQSLGLNTCWVGLFSKADAPQSTIVTIAVGYGETNGKPRRSKTAEQVSEYRGQEPEWFRAGVECALLAPTAVNRQAFRITGEGRNVSVSCRNGSYSAIDLGIVKYHFEQGAGPENFEWAEAN